MSRFCVLPARVLSDDRFSMSHLRVMAALGLHADTNGWCHPSAQTIADKVKVSRQRVSKCVSDLKEWGYLEVYGRVRESDNGQTSNQYRILFDIGLPESIVENTLQPSVAPLQSVVAPPATSGGCTPCNPLEVAPPATPGGCTNNIPVNTPLNVPLELSGAPAKKTRRKKGEVDPGFDPLAVQLPEFVPAEVWAEFVKVRIAKKNPIPSMYAATLLISELAEIKAAGHNPVSVMNTAIKKGWLSFYMPRYFQPASQPQRISPHTGFSKRDYDRGVNPDGSF